VVKFKYPHNIKASIALRIIGPSCRHRRDRAYGNLAGHAWNIFVYPANQYDAATRHGGRDHGSFIAFIKREIERRQGAQLFRYRRNGLLRSLTFGSNFLTRCVVRTLKIAVHFDRIDELRCADWWWYRS